MPCLIWSLPCPSPCVVRSVGPSGFDGGRNWKGYVFRGRSFGQGEFWAGFLGSVQPQRVLRSNTAMLRSDKAFIYRWDMPGFTYTHQHCSQPCVIDNQRGLNPKPRTSCLWDTVLFITNLTWCTPPQTHFFTKMACGERYGVTTWSLHRSRGAGRGGCSWPITAGLHLTTAASHTQEGRGQLRHFTECLHSTCLCWSLHTHTNTHRAWTSQKVF